MKLPGVEHAVIDAAKVRDYLLSPSHQVGRFQAQFFFALGYSQERWETLAADLRRHAAGGTAVAGEKSPYGQKFEVRGRLVGPSGRAAEIISVWIILRGEDAPRFVTAFPGQVMRFKQLDTVVLDRDLPEHGLRRGDLGAVVEVYAPDGLDVEFVTASGKTEALVTLKAKDVRAVEDRDLISVRPFDRSA